MAVQTTTKTTAATRAVVRRPGRWIDGWDPEDAEFWAGAGRRVARRNLTASVVAELLGFSVWALWSIVVPQLPGAGFVLSADQMFWLIAVPSLVGAVLRLPYTFAVPLFGGRNWTVVSALMLLVPTAALAVVVQRPDTPFGVLLGVAALAGFGGGNFASSMANISYFFPAQEKGAALGWNAAGGNLGTAAVQFAVPIVIVAGGGLALERAGLMFVPLVLVAAVLAWRFMDNLSAARSDPRAFAVAARLPHTWIISAIYIGTFGSFIGYSGAFPMLLAKVFPEVGLTVAFLGALVGSLARPLGGVLADRLGGARITVVSFAGMGLGALGVVAALQAHVFGLFLGAFLVLFVASGVGNGSVYRMIPAVFRETGAGAASTAGCIGIAGAVGALGGFLVARGFAISMTTTGSLVPALLAFMGVYAVLAAVTFAVYTRGRLGTARV